MFQRIFSEYSKGALILGEAEGKHSEEIINSR